jgi:glycosyltransferase involved in cell wall biosynthesis
MARFLRQEGHNVTVLTHTYHKDRELDTEGDELRVYDPSHNKRRLGMRRWQWLTMRLAVEVLNRLGIAVSIYTWWRRRVVKRAARVMALAKPDVILATYPPAETLEIALHFSKTYDLPLVSDFRDGLMFEPIERVRIGKYPCVRRVYKRLELTTVERSAAILTIADPITEYFNNQAPAKAITLSSGFDPRDFDRVPAPAQMDDTKFNILFTGRFGLSCNYNQVEFFFDAVRLLRDREPEVGERLCVHLLGEYSKRELEQLSDLIETGAVVHHGFVPREVSLASQLTADLLLIITPPDRKSATSTKIFEYLFSGRPILALTHRTVLEDMIVETGTGWIVHPHHTEEIRDLLRRVLTDVEFYNTIKPSQQAVLRFSTKHQVNKLHRLLEGMFISDNIQQ